MHLHVIISDGSRIIFYLDMSCQMNVKDTLPIDFLKASLKKFFKEFLATNWNFNGEKLQCIATVMLHCHLTMQSHGYGKKKF